MVSFLVSVSVSVSVLCYFFPVSVSFYPVLAAAEHGDCAILFVIASYMYVVVFARNIISMPVSD